MKTKSKLWALRSWDDLHKIFNKQSKTKKIKYSDKNLCSTRNNLRGLCHKIVRTKETNNSSNNSKINLRSTSRRKEALTNRSKLCIYKNRKGIEKLTGNNRKKKDKDRRIISKERKDSYIRNISLFCIQLNTIK